MMGISLANMEDYIFSFFIEIEKGICMLREKEDGKTKKKKK